MKVWMENTFPRPYNEIYFAHYVNMKQQRIGSTFFIDKENEFVDNDAQLPLIMLYNYSF